MQQWLAAMHIWGCNTKLIMPLIWTHATQCMLRKAFLEGPSHSVAHIRLQRFCNMLAASGLAFLHQQVWSTTSYVS